MGLIAKNVGGGEDFQPCPSGNHIAICTGVVSIGKHQNPNFPEKSPREQVIIMWTLPNCVREDGMPFVMRNYYTTSLHEKASLRKDLNAWRGKPFTEKELEGFNLLNILQAPCMLQVNHETSKDGRVRAKIASIASMVAGIPIPVLPSDYPILIFDDEDPDWEMFNVLPNYCKEKLNEATNWADIELAMNIKSNKPPETAIETEDDLPF